MSVAAAELVCEDTKLVSHLDKVQKGQAFVERGIGRLGPLEVTCDGEIAGQVWGAGATLSAYLLTREGREKILNLKDNESPEVVEIGAGTGLVGMAACCLTDDAGPGASKVVLTDLPESMERIEQTIVINAEALRIADVEARALTWGDLDAVYEVAPDGCDIVLGADLCYNKKSFDPLLATIYELAHIRGSKVFIATEQRWEDMDEAWNAAMARSKMEVVDEFEIEGPHRLPRPVMCAELRVREELESDDDVDADEKTEESR